MKHFFTMILFTMVFAISFVASSAVHAGTPVSEWDEPEITAPACPVYGFLGLRWNWCPSIPVDSPRDRDRDTNSTTVTTTTDDEDDDDHDNGCRRKCGGHDDHDDDDSTDGDDDKEKRSKSNASNHANERADNNNGKGGKDRDTSKNNDKGTHGNRSP